MYMYLCTILLSVDKNLVWNIPGYKHYLKWSGNERRLCGKGEQEKKEGGDLQQSKFVNT